MADFACSPFLSADNYYMMYNYFNAHQLFVKISQPDVDIFFLFFLMKFYFLGRDFWTLCQFRVFFLGVQNTNSWVMLGYHIASTLVFFCKHFSCNFCIVFTWWCFCLFALLEKNLKWSNICWITWKKTMLFWHPELSRKILINLNFLCVSGLIRWPQVSLAVTLYFVENPLHEIISSSPFS